MSRMIVIQPYREEAIKKIAEKLEYRMEQKGEHSYSSSHEILGIIAEEFDELKDAVRDNSIPDVEKELLDIAVGCAFGIASIKNGSLDW